ncbi:MAG: hypothetical protein IJ306_00200 [Oscillospiraceae bacterium]|nr:hypothetical protein [Oscillospiraceae bacterium]
MKKLLAMLLALMMVLSFAACSNDEQPVDDQSGSSDETSSTTEESQDPVDEEPTAATYTLGMGINVSTASSVEGTAQTDATVAVVVLDAEGKIVSVQIDCAQTKLSTVDGVLGDLAECDTRSKNTKKEDYGMAAVMGVPEWYVQVDALEEALVGMTAEEVAAIELVEHNGHNVALNDEVIYAACTMDLTGFKAAIAKACADEYAKEFTAENWTLGLGVVTDVTSSTDATADANGTAAFYTEFAGVVYAEDGTIVTSLLDVIQVKVGFDATGAMTNAADYDANFKSKKELKEGYGMQGVSAIGLEWMDQATNFEAAIVGMTAEEVAAIATVESNGHQVPADEALHAACSMDITGFQAVITDSLNNVK